MDNLPDYILKIFKVFNDANYQIYLVGGAIRDLLLGIPVKDWDFTTDATPEQILELFPDAHYNNKFGTVGIPTPVIPAEAGIQKESGSLIKSGMTNKDPEQNSVIEVTTMRREGRYEDSRHPTEVGWTDKLEEDLKRRDFTVNAMAMDQTGQVTDLFEGQQDLDQKIIRTVGDPDQRFKEDALRLIRAIRFASQLNFQIDSRTFESIKTNSSLIAEISGERVRDELFKILSTDNYYLGFIYLRQSGLLKIILPEVERCFGVLQEGPKHDRKYDVGEHSFLTLKECPSKDPLVRFAALLHDIGKVDTKRIQKDGNVTFYHHEVVGANQAQEIAKRLHLSNDQTDKLVRLIRWHLFTVDEHQTDSAIRRFIKNVGIENIKDMYDLRIGDRLGGGTQKAVSWRMDEYFNKRIPAVLTKPFSVSDLKINGKDIMETLKIEPGPKVGEILNKLFEEVSEDSSKNEREYLLSRIQNLE